MLWVGVGWCVEAEGYVCWGVAGWREARTDQGRVETRSQTDRLTLTLKEANAGPFSSLHTLALQLQILLDTCILQCSEIK